MTDIEIKSDICTVHLDSPQPEAMAIDISGSDQLIYNNLSIDKYSSPYHYSKPTWRESCNFNCNRYVTYIPAFLYGLLVSLKELFLVLFGCRSTFRIPPDSEFVQQLLAPFPFGQYMRKEIISIDNRDEEVITLSVKEIDSIKPFVLDERSVESVKVVLRIVPKRNYLLATWRDYYIYSMTVNEITLFKETTTADVWDHTKYLTLKALTYFVLMTTHAHHHFKQQDFMVGLENIFPDKEHELRKLHDPHCEFTKVINYSPLEKGISPLFANTSSLSIWNAHTMSREGSQALIGEGFKMGSERVRNNYGRVPTSELQPYYDAIIKLSTAVVASYLDRIVNIGDDNLRAQEYYYLLYWVYWLQKYMQYPIPMKFDTISFTIAKPTDYPPMPVDECKKLNLKLAPILVKATTENIFTVSVLHSVEHHFMGESDHRTHSMSNYIKWDAKETKLPHLSSKEASGGKCCAYQCGFGVGSSSRLHPLKRWLQQNMYNILLIKWWNNRFYCDGRLIKTSYNFKSDDLKTAEATFRKELSEIPDDYIEKSRIARSIQW